MPTVRVALASCRTLPPGEVDDLHLVRALEACGAEVAVHAWDDPGIDWSAFDLVLLRTTWDYTARLAEFLDWCARVERVTRLENPLGTVRWNVDKRYLLELERAGLRTIPTVVVEPGADLAVPSDWRARAFLKPVVGAGAEGTLRFATDDAGLARAREHLATRPDRYLLQPYLEHVEHAGEVSLLWLGDRWTHAVRKVPVPGDWRVQDDHGASDAPHDPTAAERVLAERALAWVGEVLYLRVDLLTLDSGEPAIVELELVEPSLFFRHAPEAAATFAEAVVDRARRVSGRTSDG